jgi:hypothetical protein
VILTLKIKAGGEEIRRLYSNDTVYGSQKNCMMAYRYGLPLTYSMPISHVRQSKLLPFGVPAKYTE